MGKPVGDVLADIADQLQDLAGTVRDLRNTPEPALAGTNSPLHKVAERILRQRKARTQFLPPSLFHEPAWEILLNLYVCQREGRTLNVKHITQMVDAPVITAQRWVDALAHMRLVHRVTDDADRRRVELTLTPTAMQGVERFLQWVVAADDAERGHAR